MVNMSAASNAGAQFLQTDLVTNENYFVNSADASRDEVFDSAGENKYIKVRRADSNQPERMYKP